MLRAVQASMLTRSHRGPWADFGHALLWLSCAWLTLPVQALPDEQAPLAPEFTQTDDAAWLNSAPLTLKALRGSVVLVEFWTYGCVNCQRSIPWVKALEETHRDRDFAVIGVHTPEFAHERTAQSVREKARVLGIRHPIMLDNDYAYWNAMGNRYWPAYYLIDKHGHVRFAYAGEMHLGTPRGKQVERQIEVLLNE